MLYSKMNAKQTAQKLYGLKEWPGTHVRTPKAVDCRAYTCVLLEQEGYNRKQIAGEVGFYDRSGVCHAIKTFKDKNMTDKLEGAPETIWTRPRESRLCLVSYTTKPNPIGDFVAYTRKDISDKRIAELEADNFCMGLVIDEIEVSGKDIGGVKCAAMARALKADTTS